MKIPPAFLGRSLKRIVFAAGLVSTFEIWFHVSSLQPQRSNFPLDKKIAPECHEAKHLRQSQVVGRSNATVLMLARNGDLEDALQTLKSFETQFNQWYHYPIVFLNDKPWSSGFVQAALKEVSGHAVFETIGSDMWGFPDQINQDAARAAIKDQGQRGIIHAGQENYHHMCRFYSMLDTPTCAEALRILTAML